MNIGNISSQFLNSEYVPFSSPNPASSLSNSVETGNFSDLLRKVQKPQNTQNISLESSLSSPASKKPSIDKNDKLYELCVELETFLIKNLIKSMRGTVQKSKLIDTGFAGEMYEDMLYDEYAKAYAKNANFGFAEMAYKELAGK